MRWGWIECSPAARVAAALAVLITIAALPAEVGATGLVVPTVLVHSLANPVSVAVDNKADVFVADSSTGTVSVLSRTSGEIFGVDVSAGRLTTVLSGVSVEAMAFDPSGNLFISSVPSPMIASPTYCCALSVLSERPGDIFGTAVQAGKLTLLPFLASGVASLAFDREGNMFLSLDDGLAVVPVRTGDIFGTPVTADQEFALPGAGYRDLDFDAAGDLLMSEQQAPVGPSGATDDGPLQVLAPSSATLFGQPVTGDQLANLTFSQPVRGPWP